MNYQYAPYQFEQLRLGYAAVIISILFFFRLPDVIVHLALRWNSCDPVEKSLEWVSMVDKDMLPSLEFIAQQDTTIQVKIDNLKDITNRYALLLYTE